MTEYKTKTAGEFFRAVDVIKRNGYQYATSVSDGVVCITSMIPMRMLIAGLGR